MFHSGSYAFLFVDQVRIIYYLCLLMENLRYYVGLDSSNCNIDDTTPYNDCKGILHWEFCYFLCNNSKKLQTIVFPRHLFFCPNNGCQQSWVGDKKSIGMSGSTNSQAFCVAFLLLESLWKTNLYQLWVSKLCQSRTSMHSSSFFWEKGYAIPKNLLILCLLDSCLVDKIGICYHMLLILDVTRIERDLPQMICFWISSKGFGMVPAR